jgi:FG-GAP repeat
MHGLSRVCHLLATWRVLALATVVAAVMAVAGVSPAIASASLASLAPQRSLHHGAHAVPGSGLTLAQTPAGLRSAVRRTLGAPATSAASASRQATLTASDRAKHDNFGWSVALSGSTAVVGADAKNSGTGAAYVFTRSGSTWTQQAKLTVSGGGNDFFGNSVTLSGTTAVVGAYGRKSFTGAAYVFAHV